MIRDDTTRLEEEARARTRRPSGFLESQGAHGIGWAATHGANGRGWAASEGANGIGFAAAQGANGIGWVASQASNVGGWTASQDPLRREVIRASHASHARPEVVSEVVVVREVDLQRPVTRPGVGAPLRSDSELR